MYSYSIVIEAWTRSCSAKAGRRADKLLARSKERCGSSSSSSGGMDITTALYNAVIGAWAAAAEVNF